MFKIATWNVNSLRVRLPHVLQWLEEHAPDAVALQETKTVDEEFPLDAIRERGYEAVYSGQKTYNGVAILSRTPASDVKSGFPELDDPQRRVLLARYGDINVLNLYVPNGSEVGSDKYAYKLDWFTHLHDFVRGLLADNPRLIVLGDFNVAPDDRDVHDPARWAGQVLCSEPERQAFTTLLEQGLSDCFRRFEQEPGSFTWWDYRAAAFRRNHGLRIDHILAGADLAAKCRSCTIDRTPRTWERPSDHAPVIAEFDLH
jgi:exodeoxyribonuclease-3